MRYPKTPDLDIMNGVHIIRSLHVKKEDDTFDSTMGKFYDRKNSNKPTWLVFDKQVSYSLYKNIIMLNCI